MPTGLPAGVSERQLDVDARRHLTELRGAINQYHGARLTTNAAITGTIASRKGLAPWEIAAKVKELRDVQQTNNAVSGLRDLLQLLYGRAPTESELEAGPPSGESLGVWVIPGGAIAMTAIVGGAWTLGGLFDYLTQRELRIQSELGIEQPTVTRTVMGVLPKVALAGGVVAAGALLWKAHKKKKAAEPEGEPESEDDHEPDPASKSSS